MKSLVKGSTAHLCGRVHIGDEIVAVDGRTVSSDSLAELAQKILGETGSKVCTPFATCQICPPKGDLGPMHLAP